METISDDVLRSKLDAALKAQGHKKAVRNAYITEVLSVEGVDRDAIIELNENVARDAQYKQKDDARIPLEKEEQKAFVAWYRQTFPGSIIMMIRNDGYRTPSERTEQLLMGLHPGAADLFIPELRLWIEMKRVKGGKLSNEQLEFKADVGSYGYRYAMAEGCDMAKEIVLSYKNKS